MSVAGEGQGSRIQRKTIVPARRLPPVRSGRSAIDSASRVARQLIGYPFGLSHSLRSSFASPDRVNRPLRTSSYRPLNTLWPLPPHDCQQNLLYPRHEQRLPCTCPCRLRRRGWIGDFGRAGQLCRDRTGLYRQHGKPCALAKPVACSCSCSVARARSGAR